MIVCFVTLKVGGAVHPVHPDVIVYQKNVVSYWKKIIHVVNGGNKDQKVYEEILEETSRIEDLKLLDLVENLLRYFENFGKYWTAKLWYAVVLGIRSYCLFLYTYCKNTIDVRVTNSTSFWRHLLGIKNNI